MHLKSISRLSDETGFDRRTVKKRLANLIPVREGRSLLYDPVEALPLLYSFGAEGEFDLAEQRARLTFHQANLEAMKEDERRGASIPAVEVEKAWLDHVMSARAVLLALPTKLAPAVMGATTMREVETFAREEIYRALDALESATAPDDD